MRYVPAGTSEGTSFFPLLKLNGVGAGAGVGLDATVGLAAAAALALGDDDSVPVFGAFEAPMTPITISAKMTTPHPMPSFLTTHHPTAKPQLSERPNPPRKIPALSPTINPRKM